MKILVFGGDSDIAKQLRIDDKDVVLIDHKTCDITKPKLVDSFIRRSAPDVVINCAGIVQAGLIKNQKSEDWENQITINLIGCFYIAQAAVKYGVKTIIFIGSGAGLYGKPNFSAYSASKAGVISLVQSLGMEGINAYCISPGGVDTKMREKDFPGEDKRKRLSTKDVVKIILDCIQGKYKPGENIILRKHAFRKIIRIDRGQPWRHLLHYAALEKNKKVNV